MLLKAEQPKTVIEGRSAKTDTLTASAASVREALSRSHTIVDVAPEGAEIKGSPRFTPLFFSPELWQVSLDDQQKNVIIDIYDPSAPPLHEQVPNVWFIQNDIADALGRSDGLDIDSDNDGFSNLEEYLANTHPADASSMPPLVQANKAPKLEAVKVEKSYAVLTVDSNLAYEEKPTEAVVRIFAKVGDQTPLRKIVVHSGDSFDLNDKSTEGRFTVVGFEKVNYTDSVGNPQPEMALKVRDNITLAGEKEFTIRPGRPRPDSKDAGTPNAKGHLISDTTVTLRVTAGSAAGKPEGTFRVPLKGTFKVPGAPNITCVLESVDAAGSVNVRPEGAESPVSVPKAAN